MRNLKRCVLQIYPVLFALLVVFLAMPAQAHPGRTDSSGGHWNRSTGEYHYHHGYSAHQHPNGQCKYDFDDKTGSTSGSSSSYDNSRIKTTTAPIVRRTTPSPIVLQQKQEISGDSAISIAIIACVLLIFVLILIPTKRKKSRQKNEIPGLHIPEPTSRSEFQRVYTPPIQSASSVPLPAIRNAPDPPATRSIPLKNAATYKPHPSNVLPACSNPVSGWNDLDPERVARALLLRPIRVNRTLCYAEFASSKGAIPYKTTLQGCTCEDHYFRHVKCKHMIRLAMELGYLNESGSVRNNIA